jgi:hypothetical protein
MLAFETQRIPTSKKTKQWRKNQVDAICSRIDEFNNDWYRIWQNHRLKNNQINQEEYREYCDTLGLKRDEGRKFVEPFNLTHNIIEVLKGEEAKMPWAFGVINTSPKATNQVLRERELDFRNYMDNRMASEIDFHNHKRDLFLQMSQGAISGPQMEQQLQEKRKALEERDKDILNPEQIKAKYKSYKSKKEIAVHKLLKSIAIIDNLKWMKNETFEDALVAGVEAVEVCVDKYTKKPYLRQINALNLYYHRSADTPFIQDSDHAGYKEEMDISTVLDKFGDYLTDDQVKRLTKRGSSVYGADAKFHSKGGWSPSKWEERSKFEYSQHHPMANIPYGASSSNILSDGLYATDKSKNRYQGTAIVYTTYWKSQRRVGKLMYKDEYGNDKTTIVGENYPVPKRAVKKSYKPHTFSPTKFKWEWEAKPEMNIDGMQQIGRKNVISLEWIWVPEVWKGVRINGDIHVKVEPYEHAYQSLLNPYKTKIPIHGYVYGNRNAFSTCVMDRIKPWQKLYYIVMSKWLKLITQDKGVIQLLNMLFMDPELGYKNAMTIAVDQGYLPYNPLAHAQGMNAGVANSHRPAERLDLSNSQQLTHYTNILEFIENMMKKAAGTPEARLAQTGSNTNVTDNQRDVAQSMNITNSIFAGHELLWQEVLQSLCETAVKSLDSQSGFIRQILSEDEIALIDLDLISLEDEYAVRVGNNSRAHQTLQEARGFVQALIQNDKINFSTLLDLLGTDNLGEFQEELRAIEKDIETREAQIQEQQQKHEQELQERAEKQQELERQHQVGLVALKGEYDILGKQIAAMAWDPEKDRDRDGMPDILEVQEFLDKSHSEAEKRAMDRVKIQQEDRKIEQKQQEMEMRDRQENANRESNAALKQMETKSKERIEKVKAKNKPKTSK